MLTNLSRPYASEMYTVHTKEQIVLFLDIYSLTFFVHINFKKHVQTFS